MSQLDQLLKEFWLFGCKQASACLFGGYLLAIVVLSKWFYPASMPIFRNDLLFLLAFGFQLVLLVFRFESFREVFVILVFHLVATGMEVYKTSALIGAWQYPGDFILGIGNTPLFAGFMYSAVGSYIARIWRIFDFQFSHYPPAWTAWVLVTLVYANFFTHHFIPDIRWGLLLLTFVLFGRSIIYFKIDQKHRSMPLLVGWLLVAFFIWIAENTCTFAGIWLYPSQVGEWQMVPLSKSTAWFLLMILSFVLVSSVHRPTIRSKKEDDIASL